MNDLKFFLMQSTKIFCIVPDESAQLRTSGEGKSKFIFIESELSKIEQIHLRFSIFVDSAVPTQSRQNSQHRSVEIVSYICEGNKSRSEHAQVSNFSCMYNEILVQKF